MIKRLFAVGLWKIALIGITPVAYVRPVVYQRLYVALLRKRGMKIDGRPSFIARSVAFDGTDYGLIKIGARVTVSRDVLFLTHDYSIRRYRTAKDPSAEGVYKTVAGIDIGPDAFIGARVVILPGTSVGAGTIVGAGSVIRGSVPTGVVVAGNPAEVICTVDEWGTKVVARAIRE